MTPPPVHTVSLELPLIDLGGESSADAELARDHGFVTGTLQRSFMLGPSTLALDEGTPWVGGGQGSFLAVAQGGRSEEASAQAATSAALRALASHATAVMPWLIAPDGDELEQIEQELASALEQSRDVVRAELERRGIGGPGSLSASVACIVWPTLFCAGIGEAAVHLVRGRELRCVLGARRDSDVTVFRTRLQIGDDILLSSQALTGRVPEAGLLEALAGRGDASSTCRRLVDVARSAGQDVCLAIARIGERTGE